LAEPKPTPTASEPAPTLPQIDEPEEPIDVAALLAETTPIRFDFSTHVASEELGLPEELVTEFVVDFIQQAKENIPVLLRAHKTRDLETLQSTAHLLKGAASNLRIDPLAETLKKLQYNDDFDKVPALFDRFVGQLKALDKLINQAGL
jgi:HPt (histidine-containing phosphotransfer) domain-containing protein